MNSDPAAYGAESAGAVDTEHHIQIGLVRGLCDAVRPGGNGDQAYEILDQLLEYSEVHFMSEQLLMRLCSYPDYDDHVLDHDRMMEMLRSIAVKHDAGDHALTLSEAEEMLEFLSRHIATRDQRFTTYYLDWSQTADPSKKAPEADVTADESG